MPNYYASYSLLICYPSLLQISAKGSFIEVVEVKSCAVSPLSDSKKSPFWSVISDGCSSDQSLTLTAKAKDEDDELEEEHEERDGPETGRNGEVQQRKVNRRGREAPEPIEKKEAVREEIHPLRFSFILKPVYNNSVQFLHCSLLLCTSQSNREESTKETGHTDCEDEQRIPPLVSRSTRHQVHTHLHNTAICTKQVRNGVSSEMHHGKSTMVWWDDRYHSLAWLLKAKTTSCRGLK